MTCSIYIISQRLLGQFWCRFRHFIPYYYSYQVRNYLWQFDVTIYKLSVWNIYESFTTHVDPFVQILIPTTGCMENCPKSCREITHKKDEIKTWNNLSQHLSIIKDRYCAVRLNLPKCGFEKNLKGWNTSWIKTFLQQCLSLPFRLMISVCDQQLRKI